MIIYDNICFQLFSYVHIGTSWYIMAHQMISNVSERTCMYLPPVLASSCIMRRLCKAHHSEAWTTCDTPTWAGIAGIPAPAKSSKHLQTKHIKTHQNTAKIVPMFTSYILLLPKSSKHPNLELFTSFYIFIPRLFIPKPCTNTTVSVIKEHTHTHQKIN